MIWVLILLERLSTYFSLSAPTANKSVKWRTLKLNKKQNVWIFFTTDMLASRSAHTDILQITISPWYSFSTAEVTQRWRPATSAWCQHLTSPPASLLLCYGHFLQWEYTLKNKGASRCHRITFLSKWFHKEPLTSEEPFCFTKGSLWWKKVLQIIKR